MKKTEVDLPTPTEDQFNALNGAYKYFNKSLFKKLLPGCILNFSRLRNTHGFLAPYRWRRRESKSHDTHEISLTPTTLYRAPIEIYSTLVHEMVHLWQVVFGNPSRNGYHNKEWAEKMKELGLMPTDTGKPGGRETGQHMTHYILPNGKYEVAFKQMPEKFILLFTSLDGDLMKGLIEGAASGTDEGESGTPDEQTRKRMKLRTPSQNKASYTCPGCNVKVWGRPNLQIRCVSCQELFNENV